MKTTARSKTTLTVLLVTLICVVSSFAAREARADDGMVILRGDQLAHSITNFDKGEWGPIKAILKLYEGGYHAWRYRIYLNTYVKLADIDTFGSTDSTAKHPFLSPLSILDDTKRLNDQQMAVLSPDKPMIWDWNSEECGVEKFMLIKKHSDLYLMMAEKPAFDESGEIISQASAASLEIKLFKLTRGYFLRVAEHKTETQVCSPKDFYQQMQIFAEATIK